MNFALLVLILAIVWGAVTGSFGIMNLLLGLGVAVIALFFVRDRVTRPNLLRRMWRIVSLIGLFLYELMMSAIRVAVLVAAPDMGRRVRPAIIAYPLTVTSDVEITLLSSLITLTPGTLSVDVSKDRKTLYVHVLELHDEKETIRSIRTGFEAKIIEVFEP
ncbi:Na+/H+ antiporter subunit E [Pelagibacterium xiamenense]|uniref:Na+/H+ antiporter subunit E n=1 Tax=Pelagibacterium xiamenense TaxID=2901140 RepID=UPI001E5FAF89|nr:Na+/H+ antiporter subunit E [Pelagibacterium xiamenense]MCD7059422.1 Na+/H+ antiporter subunit E [Pelagibacterium xiamenense]